PQEVGWARLWPGHGLMQRERLDRALIHSLRDSQTGKCVPPGERGILAGGVRGPGGLDFGDLEGEVSRSDPIHQEHFELRRVGPGQVLLDLFDPAYKTLRPEGVTAAGALRPGEPDGAGQLAILEPEFGV